MEYQSAISLAIDNIEDIEALIDDNQKVYSYRFRYELVQSALIIPCWRGSSRSRPDFAKRYRGEHPSAMSRCLIRCGVSFHVTASETV